jgi:lysozyme
MIKINDDCINLIKLFEGFSKKAYHGSKDKPNIDTIGYGTIKYPSYYLEGKFVKVGDPDITEQQAFDFLKNDVNKILPEINTLLIDSLTENQFGAIVSFCYNLGTGSLKISHLREKININPNDTLIRNEFMKWTCSNGECGIKGLVRRRVMEADFYFKK